MPKPPEQPAPTPPSPWLDFFRHIRRLAAELDAEDAEQHEDQQ